MLKTILVVLCVIVMMPLALCSLSVIGVGGGIVKTVSVVQDGLHQKLEQKGQVIPMPMPAQAAAGATWTNDDSDWTKGLRWGLQNVRSATCDAPPIGIANLADWSLGCRSGQKGHH
jgi:hypothetical protein